MNKKYSRIIRHNKRDFRYNYDRSLLEYITLEDIEYDKDNNLIVIKLKEPIILTSIGLNKDNWKGKNLYWIEQFNDEIEEELNYLQMDLNNI